MTFRTEIQTNLDDVAIVCLDRSTIDGRVRIALAGTQEIDGPVLVRVRCPKQRTVLERLVRSLPSSPQPCEALSIPIAAAGDYSIEITLVGSRGHQAPRFDPWELDPRERRAQSPRESMLNAVLRAA